MHSGKRLGCQNPGTRGDINMQQMVIGGDTTENFHFILVVDKVDFFCIYFNHVISLSLSLVVVVYILYICIRMVCRKKSSNMVASVTGCYHLPVLLENRHMQVWCNLQVRPPASWRGNGNASITRNINIHVCWRGWRRGWIGSWTATVRVCLSIGFILFAFVFLMMLKLNLTYTAHMICPTNHCVVWFVATGKASLMDPNYHWLLSCFCIYLLVEWIWSVMIGLMCGKKTTAYVLEFFSMVQI